MLLKKINLILGYISGAMILLTGLIMLYDVFCRYALGAPSVWAQSISQYLILTAVFFGTSYCLQSGGHVNVEIIVDRVKPLPRKILMTIGYLLSLIFVGALLKSCYQYMIDAYTFGWDAQGNLPFPSFILYAIMVLGSAMLAITLIALIINTWMAAEPKEGIKC